MVLGRINISVLNTKVSQELTFIRRMSGDVNETGFRFALQLIYLSFLLLVRALSHRRVSLRQGGFSSFIPAVTNTFDIYPGRFL